MITPAEDEPGATEVAPFPFSNLIGRPSGVVVRTLSNVFPGVAEVQRQVEPYAAAWRESNLAALRGSRPRWVALGDSMTQGIGASTPFQGWVGQLAGQLPTEVDIINLSQSGGRVDDVIHQQLPVLRALPPAPQGQIITVLIGSNDAMSLRHRRVMPDAFEDLLDLLPIGTVVCTIPSPAWSAKRANLLIEEAARAGRVRAVVPTSLDPSAWRGRLAVDRFHPNDAGYAMIAEVFAEAVRDAVTKLT